MVFAGRTLPFAIEFKDEYQGLIFSIEDDEIQFVNMFGSATLNYKFDRRMKVADLKQEMLTNGLGIPRDWVDQYCQINTWGVRYIKQL